MAWTGYGFDYEHIICKYRKSRWGLPPGEKVPIKASGSEWENWRKNVKGFDTSTIYKAHAELRNVLRDREGKQAADLFPLYNGDMARLERYSVKSDTSQDTYFLLLDFSRTNYFSHIGTHKVYEREILESPSASDNSSELGGEQIGRSNFANNLAVHVCVITSDNKVILRRRTKVGQYAGLIGSAVSGDFDPKYDREWFPHGWKIRTVNPFFAAGREFRKELGYDLALDEKRDIVFNALIRTWERSQPLLLGETRVKEDASKVLNSSKSGPANEKYEGNCFSQSFEAESIYQFLQEEERTARRNLDSAANLEDIATWEPAALMALLLHYLTAIKRAFVRLLVVLLNWSRLRRRLHDSGRIRILPPVESGRGFPAAVGARRLLDGAARRVTGQFFKNLEKQVDAAQAEDRCSAMAPASLSFNQLI